MAGLVPAIHVSSLARPKDVDARDKRGHDESRVLRIGIRRCQGSIAFYFQSKIAAGLMQDEQH